MTDTTPMLDPPVARRPTRSPSRWPAPDRRRHRRGRREGTARPDARPPGLRDPDLLPAPARRLRLDGRADDGADVLDRVRWQRRVRDGRHRPGHLRRAAHARDAPGGLPGAHGDGRVDQPGAREADPRDARRDADHVGRDRPRQAVQRAHLRLAAHRRLDPADRHRVRLRWGRARGRAPRLPRPDRHGAGLRLVRAAVLEPRQADPGGDRDHHLRRPGGQRRDALLHHLLAGASRRADAARRRRPGQRRAAGADRLPQPVPGPGRHRPDRGAVRDGHVAALLLLVPVGLPVRREQRRRQRHERRRGDHR